MALGFLQNVKTSQQILPPPFLGHYRQTDDNETRTSSLSLSVVQPVLVGHYLPEVVHHLVAAVDNVAVDNSAVAAGVAAYAVGKAVAAGVAACAVGKAVAACAVGKVGDCCTLVQLHSAEQGVVVAPVHADSTLAAAGLANSDVAAAVFAASAELSSVPTETLRVYLHCPVVGHLSVLHPCYLR